MTKTIAVHNGGYHADDVFAVATVCLTLEKNNETYDIVRTRDQKIIDTADVVIDVGGLYNEETKRFDHHMTGGAGERENGIPYAAFGLVWKYYGPKIASSPEIWERFDAKIVQSIDAVDNGVSITTAIYEHLYPYTIHAVLGSFQPAWNEKGADMDKAFFQAVNLAKTIIERELAHLTANATAEKVVTSAYESAADKQLIVIDETLERSVVVGTLTQFSEPLLAVYQHRSGDWHAVTCRDSMDSFEARTNFPKTWGGLTGEALEKATNIQGATFCHPKLFLCGADTKKATIALAVAALE